MHNPPRRQFLRDAAKPADLVPRVDPEHLRVIWHVYRDFHVSHPGEPVWIEFGSLRGLLPETADVYAVDYRAGMLNMLHHILSDYSENPVHESPISRLISFRLGADFDDRVIRAMARIRLEWMQMGFAYSGWPYDVEEFVHEVERESI